MAYKNISYSLSKFPKYCQIIVTMDTFPQALFHKKQNKNEQIDVLFINEVATWRKLVLK